MVRSILVARDCSWHQITRPVESRRLRVHPLEPDGLARFAWSILFDVFELLARRTAVWTFLRRLFFQGGKAADQCLSDKFNSGSPPSMSQFVCFFRDSPKFCQAFSPPATWQLSAPT